jgi:hypothetical protein
MSADDIWIGRQGRIQHASKLGGREGRQLFLNVQAGIMDGQGDARTAAQLRQQADRHTGGMDPGGNTIAARGIPSSEL